MTDEVLRAKGDEVARIRKQVMDATRQIRESLETIDAALLRLKTPEGHV